MSSISAGTTTGTALVSTGDTTGQLDLKINGTTQAVRINTSGAIGVGTSPAFGSSGQVLTSAGSAAAPTWSNLPASAGVLEAVATGSLANGDKVVINTDGTVSAIVGQNSAIGTEASIASSTIYLCSTYDSTNDKIVVAYRDSNNSDYGTAAVGTVSGTTISFGTPVVFLTALVANAMGIAYDSNSNRVVIVFGDNSNSNYATAVVGTVSGTSISFGSKVVAVSEGIGGKCAVTFDSVNNKIVIAASFGGSSFAKAVVGNVSGTSISFGSVVTVDGTDSANYESIAFDSTNGKVVIAYADNTSPGSGAAIVGTVSGTSISFGTAVPFSANAIGASATLYDPTSGKIIIAFRDNSDGKGKAIVGTVSGTSISFGTVVTFASSAIEEAADIGIAYDTSANKVVISYRDTSSTYGNYVVGTVSGTSISFGTNVVFKSASTSNISNQYDTATNKNVFVYTASGGKSAVVTIPYTTLTAENYIGISNAAYTNGQTATIQIVGSVDDAQTSLTAGQVYYVQLDGTLGLAPTSPSVVAGTAVSATKLIIKG